MNLEYTDASNPEISIIIPVYNVEKYIRHCLDSIKSQTFKNWECILIDDGSSDNSGKISDEYVANDGRFKVIHKKNEGASIARNKGLELAMGKYISFVDSDDYIDSCTYEVVLKTAKQNNADLVQWGISVESEKKIIRQEFCKDGIIKKDELIDFFTPSSCHKLFLKKIICANNISFPSGLTLSEDRLFSFFYYLKSSKIYGISDCYYHYIIHSESSTHRMSEKNIKDEETVIHCMEEVLEKEKADSVFEKILINQKIEAKNHALFLLEKPNCKLWRKLYPEVLSQMLKTKNKKLLIYILLVLHLDFLVKIIIKIYAK